MATLPNLFRFNAIASAGFGLQFIFRPKAFLTELTIDDPKNPAFLEGAATLAWMWGLGIQTCLAGTQYLIATLPIERQIDFARIHSLWWAVDAFVVAYVARDRTSPHVLANAGLMGALSALYAYFGFVCPAIEQKQK